MKTKASIKDIVKEKYGRIARGSESTAGPTSCCGPSSGCCGPDYTVFSESYDGLSGYQPDADLGLGCGLPTEYSGLEPGQSVLDLGSGAGNDCFVARAIVGENGRVTGLDFSDEMTEKARTNALKLGYENVEFVSGDIEDMPFKQDSFDVVISNCVLNLVPDKHRAFTEIMRVLRPGGHFCVSDVVIKGRMPEKLREDAEMYAGCVSGALDLDEYLGAVQEAGFVNIRIHDQRLIDLPGELLKKYLGDKELDEFLVSGTGILSVTVSAEKRSV